MNTLPNKVADKVLEISQGINIGREPLELVMDAIIRITGKYFEEENSPKALSQLATHIQKQFHYLTNSEVEYAFDLVIEGILEQEYKPKSLTFQYAIAVLKSYSSATYSVKFKPKQSEGDTPAKKYERLLEWVKFYKMMPEWTLFDYPIIIDHLIETRQISKPEGWQSYIYGNMGLRAKLCTDIMTWWINLTLPNTIIYDVNQNNPYNKGAHPHPGTLGQHISELKKSLSV